MEFSESDITSYRNDMEDESEESGEGVSAHVAAGSGQLEVLTQAIREDPAVLELQDHDGLTPLSHAVSCEQIEAVKLLVKMGANINCQDALGRTCLSLAAYQGWHAGVVFLMRNGARLNMTDKSGRTPLHSATYCTDTSTLNVLLQNITEEDLHTQDNEGMTALHWACFHDRPEHVETLLIKGMDPLLQDIDGRTALHWAAQNGNVACCALLAESAAELVNEQDYSGKRAIHFAAAAGHHHVLRRLAHVATCDVQPEDNDDRTPLHWAAATGQLQTLKTLLDLNVDPNPVDIDDGTPLDYARQSGHMECVKVLEERLGLQPSIRDPNEQPNKTKPIHTESDSTKSKRNPFSFLADLFRSRKTDKSVETNHTDLKYKSSEDSCTSNSSDISGLHKRGKRASDQLDVPGGSTNSSPSLRSRGSLSHDVRLSTPKKQRDSEVLRSIEMIHLSREDNPAINKLRQSEQALDSIANNARSIPMPQHSGPQWDSGKAVLPPTHLSADSLSSSPLPHNVLVRSPPPVIKCAHSLSSRENSLSPVPSGRDMFSSRQEYTREQIEHDAAEILGLSKVSGLLTDRSTPQVDDVTPRSLAMSDESYSDSPGGLKPRPGKVKLAPLRGPVPSMKGEPSLPSPSSPNPVLLNKSVAQLRRESRDACDKRPPTPPSWDTLRQNSNTTPHHMSSSPNTLEPTLEKRKKKRKKENMKLNRSLSHTDSSTDDQDSLIQSKSMDSNSRQFSRSLKESRAVNSSPRAAPGKEGMTVSEQRQAIDKSMRSLLH